MNIIIITFKGEIKQGEIQYFRGTFIKKLGYRNNILFHNHTENGLRFSYPLIQYKIIRNMPCVVGIGQGAESLCDVREKFELEIYNKRRVFDIDDISINTYTPSVEDSPKMYRLSRYIPLNHENLNEYECMPALTDRICFLERIIKANILSFFKGINYRCKEEIHVAISSIDSKSKLYYKGVEFKGFNLSFVSNVLLPAYIGLGKSPSVGFGTIKRIEIPKAYLKRLLQ